MDLVWLENNYFKILLFGCIIALLSIQNAYIVLVFAKLKYIFNEFTDAHKLILNTHY